jgi:hypothetical protein
LGRRDQGILHERLEEIVSFTGENGEGDDAGRFKKNIRELCYLDFRDSAIRKGAIAAHKGEPVVILFHGNRGAAETAV